MTANELEELRELRTELRQCQDQRDAAYARLDELGEPAPDSAAELESFAKLRAILTRVEALPKCWRERALEENDEVAPIVQRECADELAAALSGEGGG